MLGKGSELVVWMCARNINDNINFAASEWLKKNPDLEVVATRPAGAQAFNEKQPRWLMSIARLAPDGSPIVWTSEDRNTGYLTRWATTVFGNNPDAMVVDIQISGANSYGPEEKPLMIDPTWALLIIARKKTSSPSSEERSE